MVQKNECRIVWNSLDPQEWDGYFNHARRSTLLQDYAYARAICPLNRQKARWGMIEMQGQPAGLVQIREVGVLRNMIHAVMLDRGPLWLDGYGSVEDISDFLKEFDRIFPARMGRKRRIILEAHETEPIKNALEAAHFKRVQGASYQTLWIDLTMSEADLQAAMKKNWRNMLSRADRENMQIEWDDTGSHFPWLMKQYALDRAAKGYDGPSLEIMKALAIQFVPKGKMWIGRIIKDGQVRAAGLHFLHGTCATYQIGWTSDNGRKCGAQHQLLWGSVKRLKAQKYTDFDLGGVNEQSAKGVKKFKEGLGAEPMCLPGLYC